MADTKISDLAAVTDVIGTDEYVLARSGATKKIDAADLIGGVKLDDLATPDDNTDLNATTGHHGLLRKLSGTASEYLDGSGAFSTPPGGGGTSMSYVLIRDEKTQNTNGGTFTSGAWRTRDLNTEVSDTDGVATLSSNQVTLSAGTYVCRIICPAAHCAKNQARLQNVTDATTVLIGSSNYTGPANTDITLNASVIVGRFTIAASKALEVQHQCQTTRSSDGFGVAANFTTEVFTVAQFWKVDNAPGGGGGGLFDAYALLQDQKTANTAGGAATTGSFQTRTLNTEVFDDSAIVSLSSNAFTLAAGTYCIRARSRFLRTQRIAIKIRNTTDSSDAIIGMGSFSEASGSEGEVVVNLFGRVTIAGSKAFELQYQVAGNDTGNTNCLGVPANFGVVEVYSQVEIWREA